MAWANGNDAVFGFNTSGNYTITLGASLSVQSLTFNLSTYTIGSSANTLTLSGGNVTVASGVNATINQAISGSGGFTKLGLGTLTLGGANYVWEINQANGTKGSDPGWDILNI